MAPTVMAPPNVPGENEPAVINPLTTWIGAALWVMVADEMLTLPLVVVPVLVIVPAVMPEPIIVTLPPTPPAPELLMLPRAIEPRAYAWTVPPLTEPDVLRFTLPSM